LIRRAFTFLGLLAALAALCTPVFAYSVHVPDFNKLERQLRLKPAQKAQFDLAVQASQRALMSVALAGLQVKERLAEEFAKPLPDLNALYRAHEEVVEMAAPNFREAHAEWERLYTMLDRAQVDAAKKFIREQLGFLAPAWR
jgi:hypothetical protein